MTEKVTLLDVNIDRLTMEQAVEKGMRLISEGGFHSVFTPNPEIIWRATNDTELKTILNEADMLLADGIGVVIGSRLIGDPLPERVAGFDFACNLMKQKGLKFFFFGAKPGIAEEAAARVKAENPEVQIAGTHNGYFTDDETDGIIEEINQSGADVLLVCLGVPKQEQWIYKNKDRLKPSLCLGVGGTLDVLAGSVKRAPAIFQKLGLEWLYRTVKQPSRLGRIAVLPLFLLKVIFQPRRNKK